MEWAHRVLGRVIGLAFVLPASYLVLRGRLGRRDKMLAGVGTVLIGLQGFLGWYMVKSGLDPSLMDHAGAVPRVSQYRLAAHLGTALLLYSGFLWRGLAVLRDGSRSTLVTPSPMAIKRATTVITGLVFLTALSGAFVAGLDAGLVCNDFPYMNGNIIPPATELLSMTPRWRNMFENPTTAQFDHRVMAGTTYAAVTSLFALSFFTRYDQLLSVSTQRLIKLAFAVVNLQALLGIATLVYLVPTDIAAAHQAGSVLLLSTVLALAVTMRRGPRSLPHTSTIRKL